MNELVKKTKSKLGIMCALLMLFAMNASAALTVPTPTSGASGKDVLDAGGDAVVDLWSIGAGWMIVIGIIVAAIGLVWYLFFKKK